MSDKNSNIYNSNISDFNIKFLQALKEHSQSIPSAGVVTGEGSIKSAPSPNTILSNITQSDKVSSGQKSPPSTTTSPNSSLIRTMCLAHPEEVIKWFCTQCNMFLCGDCIVESHNGHSKIVKIRELEISMKNNYDLSGDRAIYLWSFLKQNLKYVQTYEDTLNDIKSFFAELHNSLSNEELRYLKVVTKEKNSYLKLFESHKNELEMILDFRAIYESTSNLLTATTTNPSHQAQPPDPSISSSSSSSSTTGQLSLSSSSSTIPPDGVVQEEKLNIIPKPFSPPNIIVNPDLYYKEYKVSESITDADSVISPPTISMISATEKHVTSIIPTTTAYSTQYVSGAQFHVINPHIIPKMKTEDFIMELKPNPSLNKFIADHLNTSVMYKSFEFTDLGKLSEQWLKLSGSNDNLLLQKKMEPSNSAITIPTTSTTSTDPKSSVTTSNMITLKPIKYEFMVNDTVVSKSLSYLRQACELVVNDLSIGNESTEKYIKENTIKFIYCLCGMENTQHLNLVEVYDIQQNRWGLVDSTRMKRACSSSSVVSIRDYIYVFGGNDSLSTYERMDLFTGKWDCLDNIQTTGGSSLAAVYDEGRYIYLIGGIQNNKTLGRVDRFDIMTGRCVNIGQLKRPRYYCFACYLDGIIYVVGGTHKEPEKAYTMVNDIEAFSVIDGSSKQVYSFNNSPSRVEGFCFDKREYIYFLTSSVFCRFSIFTRKPEALAEIPIKEGKFGLSLVFGFVDNSPKIYLIGGKHQTNFVYDINANKWETSFPLKSRYTYFHGAVGVGDLLPKASDIYQMQLLQQKQQQQQQQQQQQHFPQPQKKAVPK